MTSARLAAGAEDRPLGTFTVTTRAGRRTVSIYDGVSLYRYVAALNGCPVMVLMPDHIACLEDADAVRERFEAARQEVLTGIRSVSLDREWAALGAGEPG